MSTTTENKITEKLTALDITMSAEFVPFSKSRNAGEMHESINWKVRLYRNNSLFLETDYCQGIGHLPTISKSTLRNKARDLMVESGRVCIISRFGEPVLTREKLLAPTLSDVLYSILIDSDAYFESFEDWCGNFGFDSDSIKALGVYQECSYIGKKFFDVFSMNEYDELRDIFADY